MVDEVREPIFAVVLVSATGLALTTYMLGVLLNPLPAILASGVLVVGGAAFLVPEGQRATTAVMALLAVGLAGVVIPRLVAQLVTVRDELTLTLTLSGVVLLLTIALLQWTVFGRRRLDPS